MTHIAKSDQEYRRLQGVAKMGKAGEFVMNHKRYQIWQYMTFYTGPNSPPICAEFSRPATIDAEGFLQIGMLKEGEIVVKPGLIYKKIPMSGMIMAEHMFKMKTFKPRDIVQHVKDTTSGAVDLGTIDLRTKH